MAGDQGAAAAGWHRQALDLARSHGLAAAEAASVYSLGAAAWMAGDLAGAEARMAESFELFGRLAGHDETVPTLIAVAEVTLPQRGAPGLRLVFEDTLQSFHEVTCEIAAGYVLLNWANVARSAGDTGRGRSLLDRALAHFERCESDRGCADAWGRLANVELADGNAEAAAELFGRVRALRTELGDRRGIALALVGLGRAAAASGAERRAERFLLDAADTFRRAGDRWGLASTLWRASELELERGRLEAAEQRLAEALRVVDETRRARWQAITRVNLAGLALLRRDAERARALFESALPALERDDPSAAAYVRGRLGALAKEAQRERKATPARTGATRSTRRRNA
jgi:tetratricopeptide (TPR) repeat protein